MYTYKVMIHPNNKQETKIRRTLNKCIECNNIVYDYLDSFIKNKQPFPKCNDVRKWFTVQKNIKDKEAKAKRASMTKAEMRESYLDTLFYDVSNDALKQEIKDTYSAFIRFFKKLSKYPVRKDYKSYKKTFYVDPFKIEFTDRKVKLEKIANNQKNNRLVLNWVSLAECDRIPTNIEYSNPRVVYEGNRFYIVVSVDDTFAPKRKMKLDKDKKIGVDVNIKSIVTSDNEFYDSITKLPSYLKTKKLYKRAQKRLSRKYIVAKDAKKKLRDSKKYIKERIKVNKYAKKLRNLREQHIIDTSMSIINKRPSVVGVETLKVKEMMEKNKNKREEYKINRQKAKEMLSPEEFKKYEDERKKENRRHNIAKSIQENPFAKFITTLEQMAKNRGITVVKANEWYASSKKCSKCGNKKEDLKLEDRVYNCNCCGLVINRDYNAALNLLKNIS